MKVLIIKYKLTIYLSLLLLSRSISSYQTGFWNSLKKFQKQAKIWVVISVANKNFNILEMYMVEWKSIAPHCSRICVKLLFPLKILESLKSFDILRRRPNLAKDILDSSNSKGKEEKISIQNQPFKYFLVTFKASSTIVTSSM